MHDRTSLVLELINNPKTIAATTQALVAFGWFCDGYLAFVSKRDVLAVLKRFELGELTAAEVKAWANAIGGRTDIGFEFGDDGVVEESLYWLANPDNNWPIDADLCQRIVVLYERRKIKRSAS
jgi:hypothetical protein